MWWLLLSAAAAFAVATAKSGAFVATPAGSRADPDPDLEGKATITYQQSNAAGTVGGLVAFTEKNVPNVRIPVAGWIGKAVSGVVEELFSLAAQWGDGTLYPDQWTEPDGQIDQLTAFTMGPEAKLSIRVDVYAGFGDDWYPCRSEFFNSEVSASTVLRSDGADHFPPENENARVACLYSLRKYAEAGLKTKRPVAPLPKAPGEIEIHAQVRGPKDDRTCALYVWLPPRLGKHRITVTWRIWR